MRSMKQANVVLLAGLVILLIQSIVIAQGEQSPTSVTPLDVILLIDSSPSMEKTDPDQLRVHAARFLLDYLEATSQVLGVNYRGGVVNFGGTIGKTASLRPLQGGAVRDSIVAERIPFTDFRPPLDFALREFRARSFGSGNTMAIVLFTDGEPQLGKERLSQQDKERYFRGEEIEGDASQLKLDQLVGELQTAGVEIFVVAIGDARKDAALWQSLIPADHYRSIDSTTNLAQVYHDFATDLIGGLEVQPQTLLAGQESRVVLDPYLEYALFSFVKDTADVTVSVSDPRGIPQPPTLGGGPDNLYEIYTIKKPQEGAWQVKAANGGALWWLDQRLPVLTVTAPESPQVLGQPVVVSATLLRDQAPVTDERLELQAVVKGPEIQQTYQMERKEEGRYEIPLEMSEPGV
ncbi:MAG TPA: VWA domain-containing protein, partial [Methylothermaceae bacterium]|nr:VWA domain-containing protein [Methylothermaceae bacterium]